MKKLLLVIILVFPIILTSQINTVSGVNCIDAVDNITGVGVNISNISCNCSGNALGSFNGATNLPISSGTILSTGNINQITNGGCVAGSSISNGNGSTGNLNGLAGNSTYDQCTVEFDIIPTCNTLQISFFYGSEEYPEYVNSGYNDAFAFFITGPGITGTQNLAVVPGTTTPVTINTINGGTNSNYFNSNGSCGNGIEFDGYTNQLTTFANVQQCQSYHMVITIADAGDAVFDSGVFLLQNGLSCPNGAMNVNVATTDNNCSNECNGMIDLSISGGASPYTVTWEHTSSNSTSLTNLCDGNYIVDITDNTCNEFKDTITINSTQNLLAGFRNDTMCLGNLTTFVDTSLLDVGTINSWEWNFDDGNTSTLENPNHTFANDGSYNVELIVTSDIGCKDTVNKTVLIYPNPLTNFTVDDVCLTNPSIFLNGSSINPPDNIATYSWTFGDGNTSTLENPNYTYATEGTYNVKLVLQSNNGCLDSMQTTTRINPKPMAAFTVNDDCINIPAQFTDNSIISSGNIVNWEWNFDDGTPFDVNQSPSHLYSNDGTYNPTLIVTSDFGCKDTIQQATVRHAMPLINFSAIPVCQYDSMNFINNTSINAPSTITNWIWNFGDGSPFSAINNPKHKYNLSGVYNVSLIASSNFGCVSDASLPVQVFSIPSANFSNTSVCENKPPMYFIDISSVNNGSITGWQWDFGDGNTSTFQVPSNNYTTAGIYDVQLIVNSNNNCVDTVEIPVTVDPKPVAEFIADITEDCSPVCVNYTDNSLSNASNIAEWQWNLGNGEGSFEQNPTTCYINNSNTDDVNYSVSLIVKNNLGCYE